MGRLPKLTVLEQEVCDAWEALTFGDAGFKSEALTRGELDSWECDRREGWDAILAKAHLGGKWQVGAGTAAMLTASRWYNAMILREYARAIEEIERCLQHPGPFDRLEQAELPMRAEVARLAAGDHVASAARLTQSLECGIYRPGVMARLVAHLLIPVIEDLPLDESVPEEVRMLAKSIARALKRSKKLTMACAASRTWRDLRENLLLVLGPEGLARSRPRTE